MNIYTALRLIAFSFWLHTIFNSLRTSIYPPQVTTNCLHYRYSGLTPAESFLGYSVYHLVSYCGHITNQFNIPGYLYTSAGNCHLATSTVMKAFEDRPLIRNLFDIIFGHNPNFKIVESERLSPQTITAAYMPESQTLLIHELRNHTPFHSLNGRISLLTHPTGILRREFMLIFIDLFTQHAGNMTKDFYTGADEKFQQSVRRINQFLDSYTSKNPTVRESEIKEINLKLMESIPFYNANRFFNQINILQQELRKYQGHSREERAKQMLALMAQLLPEEIIKEYFPDFYQHIKYMVTFIQSLDLHVQTRPLIFSQPDFNYTHVVNNAECMYFAHNITSDEMKELESNTQTALDNLDRAAIMQKITHFENDNWRCSVNRLEKSKPAYYGRIHLITARCYYFAGDYDKANQHYRKAWHKHIAFTDEDVRAHYVTAFKTGKLKGSLRRAYNQTVDVDDTYIESRYHAKKMAV